MVAPGQANKLVQIISSESESKLDEPKLSEEMGELLNAYDQADTEKQRIIFYLWYHLNITAKHKLWSCLDAHKVDMARKWQRAYGPLQQRPEKR